MPKKYFFTTFSFFIIIAVILLLIFFNYQGWMIVPKNIVYQIASPFLKFFSAVENRLSSGLSFFFTLKDLSAENSLLRFQNQSLSREKFLLKEASIENEVLRSRLNLALPVEQKSVMAGIVGYNLQLGQYILINKGFLNGLSTGLAVVNENNFLVGRVVEVNNYSAKVILISDSNSLVNVLTQESRVAGIVKGFHGLVLSMEMIPVNQQIKEGEIVFTSGLNDSLPKGLILGQIKEVIKKESEIFQKANIQVAADLIKLERVFVILR